ncbi:hypothetical protein ES332_D09G152200v1 [Gossypium tomentosum]|uniref:Uncharacterized protein n=1 Tax=Gossypium tomentosum TaxID=34277 RepID=A0A5D2JI63_GOSTO|nr:hypothetical protein ES332_D09G152200v1 [Gossypium tomentosum]
MRGRSYSPSLPRDYGRRYRSPSPRGCYGDRSRDLPTSLLVRNLRHDCRFEFCLSSLKSVVLIPLFVFSFHASDYMQSYLENTLNILHLCYHLFLSIYCKNKK